MQEKELRELSDQELLEKAKKLKRNDILNATLIGFLAGVIVYSVVQNTWGLVTLIPLFLAYQLINKPKDKALKAELKERGLKY